MSEERSPLPSCPVRAVPCPPSQPGAEIGLQEERIAAVWPSFRTVLHGTKHRLEVVSGANRFLLVIFCVQVHWSGLAAAALPVAGSCRCTGRCCRPCPGSLLRAPMSGASTAFIVCQAVHEHPTMAIGTTLRNKPTEQSDMVSYESVPNGASVDVLQIHGIFAQIRFTAPTGTSVHGWIRHQYLKFLPTSTTSSFAEFVLPSVESEGMRVEPGAEPINLELPLAQRDQILRTVILVHRKDIENSGDMASWPDHGGNPDDAKGRDTKPCYTKVEARLAAAIGPSSPACAQPRAKKARNERTWHTFVDEYGAGSGAPHTQPGKFAEARPKHDPEVETLHDWPEQTCGPSHFDAFRLTNVGASAVHIHALRAYFYPSGKIVSILQQILTPGTCFGQYPPAHPGCTGLERTEFGGGEWALEHQKLTVEQLNEKGMYPDAVELGERVANAKVRSMRTLQNGSLRAGELILDVPDDAHALYLELACGDTSFNVNQPCAEQRQSDGYYGKRGWAKLCITDMQSGAKFMWMENVPPAGVLACAIDATQLEQLESPKQLLVSSRHHPTWLMGYRMLALKPERGQTVLK